MNLFTLVGRVVLNSNEATLNLRDFERAAQKTGETIKNVGSKVSSAGRFMSSFITLPILAGLGSSIKLASDMNETLSKTEVVFGKNADMVKKWSETTLKSIGLSKVEALDMASVYGDMGTAMGLTNKQSRDMAMNLVNLTGDMASFKNMRPDEIHIALTGAYTGETESLKRLGVVMTVANLEAYALSKGITKSYKEMTQAEKITLRYDFIMKSAKNSIGDFKRTQESAANQMRIFTESLKEVAVNIGMILLPGFTKVVTFVNKLIDRFRTLDPRLQKIAVIFSIVVAAIGPLLIGIGGLITFIGTLITAIGTIGAPVFGVVAALGAVTAISIGAAAGFVYLAKKTGLLQKMINGLKDIFTIFKLILSGEVVRAVDLVVQRFGVSGHEARKFVFKVVELKNTFLEFARNVKKGAREAFGLLIDYTKRAGSFLYRHRGDILKTLHTFVKFAKLFILYVSDMARTIWKIVEFGQKFGQTMANLSKKVGSILYSIKDKIVKFSSDLLYWGKKAIQNFIKGFTADFDLLKRKAKEAAGIVKSFIGWQSPTEEGPGKDSDKWGPNLIKMLANSMLKERSKLKNVSKLLAGDLRLTSGLNFENKGLTQFGTPGGSMVTVNINNPQIFDRRGISQIMDQVKEELETYMNYKTS